MTPQNCLLCSTSTANKWPKRGSARPVNNRGTVTLLAGGLSSANTHNSGISGVDCETGIGYSPTIWFIEACKPFSRTPARQSDYTDFACAVDAAAATHPPPPLTALCLPLSVSQSSKTVVYWVGLPGFALFAVGFSFIVTRTELNIDGTWV